MHLQRKMVFILSGFFIIIPTLLAFSDSNNYEDIVSIPAEILDGSLLEDGQEIVMKVRKDRVVIYNPGEMKNLEAQNLIPLASKDGVPYTDKSFVYFKESGKTYIVIRGYDARDNCRLLAMEYFTGLASGPVIVNLCNGAPCSHCVWNPESGCGCSGSGGGGQEGHCNHRQVVVQTGTE